jgi:hypothetical protein
MKARLFVLLVLLSTVLIPSLLLAQGGEVRPYVGYYYPQSNSNDRFDVFQQNQLLGVRGGYYVIPGFEIGGNFAWANHFQPKNGQGPSTFAGNLGFPQGKSRAYIWEAEFSYNFSTAHIGPKLRPYVVAAGGGLTTNITSPAVFTLNTRPVVTPVGTTTFVANDVLRDNRTYFTFSYGGGAKAERLWGPVGFFGDFRGRTIPNFFGNAHTWPEVSVGASFVFGQR